MQRSEPPETSRTRLDRGSPAAPPSTSVPRGAGPVPLLALLAGAALSALAACASPPPARGATAGTAPAGEPLAGAEAGATGPAAAPAREEEEADEDGAEGEALPLRGRLTTRYRFRNTGGTDDHDLFNTLSLDYGDAEEDAWTAHFLGWLAADLNGRASGSDPFADVEDTYDHALVGRLYRAYADLHDVESFDELRLGRQQLFETPIFLTFDGVHARTEPLGDGDDDVRLGVYAGVPVHFFESSSAGDLLAGIEASARPWEGGRLRFDFLYIEDEALLGDQENNLLGLGVWQQVGGTTLLEGRGTALDGDGRDVLLRGTYSDPEGDLTVQASYYELFRTQGDLVNELDPFYSALLELFPYRRVNLLAGKRLGESVHVEGGYDARRLVDDADEGTFNRDFNRFHATVYAEDLTSEELTLSVTGEVWDGGDDDIRSWGVDLSKEWDERWETSLGSYFSLFKFDLLTVDEREDVRTYYVDARWRKSKDLTLFFRYEFEDGSLDDYHLLKLGTTWRF